RHADSHAAGSLPGGGAGPPAAARRGDSRLPLAGFRCIAGSDRPALPCSRVAAAVSSALPARERHARDGRGHTRRGPCVSWPARACRGRARRPTVKPSHPRATATIQSRRHPMARLASQLLIALAVLTLTGTTCGRGVSIESDAGPTYTLQVRNPNPFPMIVSRSEE